MAKTIKLEKRTITRRSRNLRYGSTDVVAKQITRDDGSSFLEKIVPEKAVEGPFGIEGVARRLWEDAERFGSSEWPSIVTVGGHKLVYSNNENLRSILFNAGWNKKTGIEVEVEVEVEGEEGTRY
jgi:hypothetical protein